MLLAGRIDFSSGISAKKARLAPSLLPFPRPRRIHPLPRSPLVVFLLFLRLWGTGQVRSRAFHSSYVETLGASQWKRPVMVRRCFLNPPLSLSLSLSRGDPVFVTRFLMHAIVPSYHHARGTRMPFAMSDYERG